MNITVASPDHVEDLATLFDQHHFSVMSHLTLDSAKQFLNQRLNLQPNLRSTLPVTVPDHK